MPRFPHLDRLGLAGGLLLGLGTACNNQATQGRRADAARPGPTTAAPSTTTGRQPAPPASPVASPPAARAVADDLVGVRLVKYEGLKAAIRQLKGRVVVVDVWGTY